MIRRREQNGAPIFIVYYNRNGKRFYVGTFGTQREAKEAEQDFAATRRRIERGELPEGFELKKEFRGAAERWIKSLRNGKARAADGYETRLNLYIHRRFGHLRLSEITKAMVMDFRDELAQRYAPSTVNGVLTCLSSAFTYFIDRQWVDRHPCRGVRRVEDPVTGYDWIRTKEEMTRLLAACNDELREMVAAALATGLRIDELLHLRWADIDIDRRLITVHRGAKGTVKSGKVRYVPILDTLLPLLRERALRRGGAILVFPGREGAVRMKTALRTIYKLALQRAGLERSLRWHDLRHTFASHWMMDGGDIFKLSRILGHSNVKVTMRYAHLAPAAFEQDYGRLSFVVPNEKAKLVELRRDATGRLQGRVALRAAGD